MGVVSEDLERSENIKHTEYESQWGVDYDLA
jgi:hypothetical protein